MANNTGRGFIARSAHSHALFRLWQAALAFQEKLDVDISRVLALAYHTCMMHLPYIFSSSLRSRTSNVMSKLRCSLDV